MRLFLRLFSAALAVVFIALAILLIGVRLIGLKPFVVTGGSMEPLYSEGDLLYVRKLEGAPRSGQVVTYVANAELDVITHRIVSVDETRACFTAKGDANPTADPEEINLCNIIGEPVSCLPRLGSVSQFLCTFAGQAVSVALLLLMIAAALLPSFESRRRRPRRRRGLR